MELYGDVLPDRPLLVVALHEEAEHLFQLALPLLVTGVGKVRAATATATVLARSTPAEVVNLGTAGALADGLRGTHVVRSVRQHDFDDEAIFAICGTHFGPSIELADEGPSLSTGDRFVADSGLRGRLAEHADLVDMEGYAVAAAAQAAGVPVRLVKHVSDDGDEAAAQTWSEGIAMSAELLAMWVRARLLPEPGA